MNMLIEEYLRTRGVRYFRGHHDDEYFYLVDFGAGVSRGRLNVHLEVGGAERDAVLVSIAPDRYYPVGRREYLDELVAGWNCGAPPVYAEMHDSCDPRLVGLMAHGCYRPADAAALADCVDAAVAAAVELFGTAGGYRAHGILRDAG